MTDTDLIAWADSALDGVTEGPWCAQRWNRPDEDWPEDRWSVAEDYGMKAAIAISPRYADQDATMNDAYFIAASRQLVPALRDALIAERAVVEALEAENADLKSSVVALCAPHAGRYARDFGLPEGHLHPTHYDILAKAGARMDDFTRAAFTDASEEGGEG